MAITADTLAIVAATGLGPILAVGLTLAFTYWRETSGGNYSRRLMVFRTLMATRRAGISLDHVNSLNLVEVDFYACKSVETEWRVYKNHLNDTSRPEDEEWHKKKEKLLAKLLFEIAKVLKFDIPAIDIFEGGYSPGGWVHRDLRYIGALEYLHELREGKNTLPLWIKGVTQPPPAPQDRPTALPERDDHR